MLGTSVIAYYDSTNATLRHVECPWMVPSSVKRCQFCKRFRDNNLRSGLSKLLKQQEENSKSNTAISSHTNYRYLSSPEKIERLKNLHTAVVAQRRKIQALQDYLSSIVHTDGVRVDQVTHKELVQIMNANRGKLSTTEESFSSVFWQQQFKAASLNGPKGMRWHPAIIRWCLYLHHKSSRCYSTLRISGVLRLPSERTLRDYRHFAPSTAGFSKALDKQLQDAISEQVPQHLAKYVTLVLDEMFIKEGLFFDKHSGALVGYSDIGEVNNLLADYEREYKASGRTPKPLAKRMLVFMVRGLFTTLTFPYVQFPVVSCKGPNLMPLVRQAIKHLTCLGIVVVAITCDGASDNRKMFSMHAPDDPSVYKTVNLFSKHEQPIFFISDPPHLIKTIRNCFARGKLWVSIFMICFIFVILGM